MIDAGQRRKRSGVGEEPGRDAVQQVGGGRVLGVTCAAPTLDAAVTSAYAAVNSIKFDGMQFRRDIGTQAGLAHSAGD